MGSSDNNFALGTCAQEFANLIEDRLSEMSYNAECKLMRKHSVAVERVEDWGYCRDGRYCHSMWTYPFSLPVSAAEAYVCAETKTHVGKLELD